MVEPGKKTIPDVPVQAGSGFQGLLEHSHKGVHVSRVSVTYFLAESSSPLAVKDQQLGDAQGIAECFLVTSDRPTSNRYRRSLSSEYIRPQRSINGFLVRLQRVITQADAGMKKSPIIIIGSIEILQYVQQRGTIKSCQLPPHVCPCRF
jgi:hypothetical protein